MPTRECQYQALPSGFVVPALPGAMLPVEEPGRSLAALEVMKPNPARAVTSKAIRPNLLHFMAIM
jgi:hypothetical protein